MSGEEITLVVAEDDPILRALLATHLRNDGYTVLEVARGDDLRRLLHDSVDVEPRAFDLVLTDIRMPGISGLDALGEFRKHAPTVPVLLMSAFADAYAREHAELLGASVVSKPFNLSQLSERVRVLLRKRSPAEDHRGCEEVTA